MTSKASSNAGHSMNLIDEQSQLFEIIAHRMILKVSPQRCKISDPIYFKATFFHKNKNYKFIANSQMSRFEIINKMLELVNGNAVKPEEIA
jgi:hypothetical protein